MRVDWQANNFTLIAPNFLPDVKATQFTLSLLKYLAPSESLSFLFGFGFAFVFLFFVLVNFFVCVCIVLFFAFVFSLILLLLLSLVLNFFFVLKTFFFFFQIEHFHIQIKQTFLLIEHLRLPQPFFPATNVREVLARVYKGSIAFLEIGYDLLMSSGCCRRDKCRPYGLHRLPGYAPLLLLFFFATPSFEKSSLALWVLGQL